MRRAIANALYWIANFVLRFAWLVDSRKETVTW